MGLSLVGSFWLAVDSWVWATWLPSWQCSTLFNGSATFLFTYFGPDKSFWTLRKTLNYMLWQTYLVVKNFTARSWDLHIIEILLLINLDISFKITLSASINLFAQLIKIVIVWNRMPLKVRLICKSLDMPQTYIFSFCFCISLCILNTQG